MENTTMDTQAEEPFHGSIQIDRILVSGHVVTTYDLQQQYIDESICSSPDGDRQSQLLAALLVQTSRFSSARFKDQLDARFKASRLAGVLVKEMRRELAQYQEIHKDLQEIATEFVRATRDFQREARRVLSHLQLFQRQLFVLIDILTDEDARNAPNISKENEEELKQCLTMISQLNESSRVTEIQFKSFATSLRELRCEKITPAKERVVRRQKIWTPVEKHLASMGAAGGGVVGGAIGVGTVAAPILGGTGAVVLGSAAFPPFLAVLACIVVGATIAGSISYIIKRRAVGRYLSHQKYLQEYVNQLDALASDLQNDNEKMLLAAENSEMQGLAFETDLKAIETALKGPRQRKAHIDMVRHTKESMEPMMKTLKDVIDFDIEAYLQVEQSPPSVRSLPLH